MALDPDLLEMMTQTVTIAPLTGRDNYGKPTFGTGVVWRARIKGTNRRVVDHAGQEAVSTTEVWIGGVSGIGPTDQLTLPDGTSPPLLKVERYPDEDGNSFEKVYLGAKGRA